VTLAAEGRHSASHLVRNALVCPRRRLHAVRCPSSRSAHATRTMRAGKRAEAAAAAYECVARLQTDGQLQPHTGAWPSRGADVARGEPQSRRRCRRVPVQMRQAASPVPVQMWRASPSLSADMAGTSPSPGADVAEAEVAGDPVRAQIWQQIRASRTVFSKMTERIAMRNCPESTSLPISS
jgi:hypothetical protein